MFHPVTPRREEDFGELIMTKALKAGRRTYFFDVRATRAKEYYLTITESRKITDSEGKSSFDRHKLFLYKEDFRKFANGLTEVLDYIKQSQPQYFEELEKKEQEAQLRETEE